MSCAKNPWQCGLGMVLPAAWMSFKRLLEMMSLDSRLNPSASRTEGVATFLDDDRKEVLLEIAEYLREHYVQYGRGIAYLEQLAGVRAMVRRPASQLRFLLIAQAAVQRGSVDLGTPEIHTLHTVKVRFHWFH